MRFAVDENGFARDRVVVKREGSKDFEQPALDAMEKFRYAPRFVGGKPVAVDGILNMIVFKLY